MDTMRYNAIRVLYGFGEGSAKGGPEPLLGPVVVAQVRSCGGGGGTENTDRHGKSKTETQQINPSPFRHKCIKPYSNRKPQLRSRKLVPNKRPPRRRQGRRGYERPKVT